MHPIHVLWVVFAWAMVNAFPGFTFYAFFKKRIALTGALPFSIILSPVLNGLAHTILGSVGSPTWLSILLVQAASLTALYKIAGELTYFHEDVKPMLSVAMALTLLVSLPSVLNPAVLYRSDNQPHAGYVHSIRNTGVPPETPYLAGHPLNYYWFYDAFNLMQSTALAVHPLTAIHITDYTAFLSLAMMMWLLSKSFGGDKGVNIVSVLFMVFGLNALKGWELTRSLIDGSIRMSSLSGVGNILGALTGWGNASFMAGYLVAHPMALALPMMAAGFYCINEHRKTGHRGYLCYLLLCTVGAAYAHPPTAVYYGAAAGLYVVLEFMRRRHVAVAVAAVLIWSAAVIVPYGSAITSGKAGSVWDDYFRDVDRGVRLIKSLFEHHLKVVALFAAVGIILGRRRLNLPLLSMLLTFALAYVFVNTPGGSWKNTHLMMIPLSILAAWGFTGLVSKIPYGRCRLLAYPMLALLLLPTNVLTVYGYASEPWEPQPAGDVYQWMHSNTPSDSVFVFEEGFFRLFMSEAGRSAYVYDRYFELYDYDRTPVDHRLKVVEEVLAGENTASNTDYICSDVGRPVYVLLHVRQLARNPSLLEAFNPEEFTVVALDSGSAVINRRGCNS